MKKKAGFTLIEILVSLAVLIVGIVGIFLLFPVGLQSTKLAIEDSYAATIAESAYASLRAAAQQMAPGEDLVFFHDGIAEPGVTIQLPARNNSVGIPNPTAAVAFVQPPPNQPSPYFQALNATDVGLGGTPNANFCFVGGPGTGQFNINVTPEERNRLNQFSFNIELFYPQQNGANPRLTPKGLFDVTIRVRRANKVIKRFHSKIFIPTTID